ncbi:flagellin [uncultured Tateyamaria sp.]|uniref:flagellin n=1 Tax=uncultured Tateyamaria sp. TaxID=455651 RepID=UPI00262CB6C3|nr:flagellin [uncultured Tateyamaria sp.]
MSSILTNNSAMVALQTLKGINKNLAMTQNEISTGKSVSSAKDNSAVWAISKVMESDVKGFKAISESLSLGESTVAVGRNAAETVTDLLTDIKGKITAAQESNVDRDKIQTDITALREQIESVVGAAQFNGLNLVDGSSSTDVTILSSLDRDSSGNVTASEITVERQNLSVSGSVTTQVYDGATGADTSTNIVNATAEGGSAVVSGTGVPTTGTASYVDVAIASVGDGFGYQLVLDDTADANSLGTRTFEYVANANDSTEDVANNLYNQVNTFLSATNETNYTVSLDGDTVRLTRANAGNELEVTIEADTTGNTAGTSSGGLAALQAIDVTTDSGATAALTSIEALIDISIDAAASFGSVEGRIETQSEFVSKLTDSLTSGIGSLVDADMEEVSARLQALQTQQQLGVQSLSIANQAPQTILSLFR